MDGAVPGGRPSGPARRAPPADADYPEGWIERRVSPKGTVSICGTPFPASLALADHVVGLEPVDDRLDLWFDYLRPGHVDLHLMRFVPVTAQRKKRRPSSGAGVRRNGNGH